MEYALRGYSAAKQPLQTTSATVFLIRLDEMQAGPRANGYADELKQVLQTFAMITKQVIDP